MVKRPVLLGLYLQIILCFHYLLLIIIQLQFILRANLVYQFYCCHILPSLGYSRKNPHPPPRQKAYFFAPPNPPRFTKQIEPPPPLPSGIQVRTTVLVSIIASLVQKLGWPSRILNNQRRYSVANSFNCHKNTEQYSFIELQYFFHKQFQHLIY